jgi:hypothetical protein
MPKSLLYNLMPALVWALFIGILCGMPGTSIPHVSLLELLSFDKLVHAYLFFILATLSFVGISKTYNTQYRSTEPYYFSAISVCVAYGGILELLQSIVFVARSADSYDFVANTFGVIVAAIYFNSYKKFIPFI